MGADRQAEFRRHIEETARDLAAFTQRLNEALDGAGGLRMGGARLKVLVSREPGRASWRITIFDVRGPTGHTEHTDFDDLALAAWGWEKFFAREAAG